MRKVYWIGPIVSANSVGDFSAISAAGNLWQSSCILALKDSGIDIRVLSYLPDSFAPKGRFFPKFSGQANLGVEVEQCKYCNLPFVRNRSIARSLLRSARGVGCGDILLTYNSYPAHVLLATYFKRRNNVKWINIVAENDSSRYADATFFLSYNSFVSSDLKNRFHLDGGVSLPIHGYCLPDSSKQKKVLLFAGSISKWTGIVEFATSFSRLTSDVRSQYELHIYGKGNSSILRNLESESIGIKVKGFVPKSELDASMMNCFAFVNPRPLVVQGGETNFPSKLFEYLRFAKPIISTLTPGLSPVYEDLLLSYDSDVSLAALLRRLMSMSSKEHKDVGCRMMRFAEDKVWARAVRPLIDLVLDWSTT